LHEWILQDREQRAAHIETKWPETMEELLAPEANAQATSGIIPLADAAYKGYNGTKFTNSVISSQKTTPVLYANHTGYIPVPLFWLMSATMITARIRRYLYDRKETWSHYELYSFALMA
jgi:hypothetical protein